MSRLDHPNIANVIDCLDDGSSIYIVRCYIAGRDLLTIAQDDFGMLTEQRITEWGFELCDALSFLYHSGFACANLRPDNIVLTDFATIKLVNLSLYDTKQAIDPNLIANQAHYGYIPPEVFDPSAEINESFCVYSFGATLFHLATGHNPKEYLNQQSLPMIRTVNPTLSEGFEYVIWRATRPIPSDRYQSFIDMQYELTHDVTFQPLYASPQPLKPFSRLLFGRRRNSN